MTTNKGMSPITAGAIGVAVGAAVVGAGVAAVELSDPKNREKIQEKLGEIKEKGQEVISDIKDKAEGAKVDE